VIPTVAAAFISFPFRGNPHIPISPGSLAIHAGPSGDTLVMSQPAGGSGAVVTLAGPSQSWEVAFATSHVSTGDSIEFGGAAIVSGGDPDIKMLTATREATTEAKNVAQAVLKAKRKNGEEEP
jgi:hypothetical protein